MGLATRLKLKSEDLWGIAGLAALWPCLQSSGFYPLSIVPAVDVVDPSVVARAHLLYSLELLVFFAAAIAFNRIIAPWLQSGRILPILAGAAGITGQVMLMRGDALQESMTAYLLVATFLVALFVAFFVSLWGLRFALFNNAIQAAPRIAASYLISQIALVVYCATGLPHGIILCACAALTGVCALPSRRKQAIRQRRVKASSLRHLPWGMIVLATLLVYFCIIYIRVSTRRSFLEDSPSSYKLLSSCICALIFSIVIVYLVRRRNMNDDTVILFVLLVCTYIVGLAAILVIPPEAGTFARRFLVADEHCLEVFIWMMLTSICIRKELPPLLSFGAFGIAIVAFPWMLSFDLYYLSDASSRISDTALVSSVTVALCITALGTIAYLVRYTIKTSRNASTNPAPTQQASPQKVLEACGLTQREIEVALLILRGYSAKRIAERLYVSEPTVKSYTTRIYRKMNVHSKQDFIDCIENRPS